MSQPEFQHEYVSGAHDWSSGAARHAVSIHIVNRGRKNEFAHVWAYVNHSLVGHSNDGKLHSVEDLVRPGHVWSWQHRQNAFGKYWFRILITSLNLVPSMEFRKHKFTGSPPKPTPTEIYAYHWPRDLPFFDLPQGYGPVIEPVVHDS